MEAIGKATTYLVLAFISTMSRAFVIVKFWLWFVVPQFHVGPMRIPIALGIGSLVSLLTLQLPNENDKPYDWKINAVGTVFICAIFLFFGWVYHLFV